MISLVILVVSLTCWAIWHQSSQLNSDKSKADYIFSFQRVLECRRTLDYCITKHQLTCGKSPTVCLCEVFLCFYLTPLPFSPSSPTSFSSDSYQSGHTLYAWQLKGSLHLWAPDPLCEFAPDNNSNPFLGWPCPLGDLESQIFILALNSSFSGGGIVLCDFF